MIDYNTYIKKPVQMSFYDFLNIYLFAEPFGIENYLEERGLVSFMIGIFWCLFI